MIAFKGLLAPTGIGKGMWSLIATVLLVSVAGMAFWQVWRSLPGQPYILIWYMATMTAWFFQVLARDTEHHLLIGAWDMIFPISTLFTTLYLWWKIRTGLQNSLQTKR
ncbi:hypothetical protein [Deinococcus psychrotolerans]|nr:hypothetical protein [Deinococcus psychrotolerans]